MGWYRLEHARTLWPVASRVREAEWTGTGYGPHRVRAAHSSDSAAGLERSPPATPASADSAHSPVTISSSAWRSLAHLPGAPPRYRDVSARPPAKLVPRGAVRAGSRGAPWPTRTRRATGGSTATRADLDRPGACLYATETSAVDLAQTAYTSMRQRSICASRCSVGPLPPAQGSVNSTPARPARPIPTFMAITDGKSANVTLLDLRILSVTLFEYAIHLAIARLAVPKWGGGVM